MGWVPGLDKKEKSCRAQTFISLLPDCGRDVITHAPSHHEGLYSQMVSQNKYFLKSLFSA